MCMSATADGDAATGLALGLASRGRRGIREVEKRRCLSC